MNPKRFIGKVCAKCGGTERYKNHGCCCACASASAKARAKADPERRKAQTRAWDKAHPERKRAFSAKAHAKNPNYTREWAKANPKKRRAAVRRWRARNLDKVREDHTRWVANNPERALAINRAWRSAHPDEVKAGRAKRRAIKLGAAVGCRKEYVAFMKWTRTAPSIPCHYCKRETLPSERHRDHYIPLTKGGEDSVANLRVACANCNQRKHALMPDEFIKRIA